MATPHHEMKSSQPDTQQAPGSKSEFQGTSGRGSRQDGRHGAESVRWQANEHETGDCSDLRAWLDKNCFGNICLLEDDYKPPTELVMWRRYQFHFSEPKTYCKGSTSRAHFLSGLEFQNPLLLRFNKKFT